MSPCPACGADPVSSLACLACGRILEERPGSDHFRRLGVTRDGQVDQDELETHYLKLSRLLHPDFQARQDPALQRLALTNSALLNEARAVLKDDLKRAEYLLGLHDPDALERNKQLPQAFLMETMELSEELDDARGADDGDAVQRIAGDVRAEIEKRTGRIAEQLAREPLPADELATLIHELRVYRRILRDTGVTT